VDQLLNGELYAEPDANPETLEVSDAGTADTPAASVGGHEDAPADTQQQEEEATATPALNCDQEVAVQGRASRTRGAKKSALPTNSLQKNTKYSLRKKRSPPKKLMTVISRTSFTRGGGDVEL